MTPSISADRPDHEPPEGRPDPRSDPAFRAGLRPIPSGPVESSRQQPAADIVGLGPSGASVEVVISATQQPALLLCFLHVRCDGCAEFWGGLKDSSALELPPDLSTVVVTRGPESMDPAEVERAALGIHRVQVVMSDQTWDDYRVLGYPFFVLVDPQGGTVIGETVGLGWSDVLSMVEASRP
jgi:hypothetical protein